MFTGTVQPTDVHDNSNMKALSCFVKCCAMLRYMSALAGIYKQKHSTVKL